MNRSGRMRFFMENMTDKEQRWALRKAYLGLIVFVLFEVLLVWGGIFSMQLFIKTLLNIVLLHSTLKGPIDEQRMIISKVIMMYSLYFGSCVVSFTIIAFWISHLLREISFVLNQEPKEG